jgi:hypothetical protein
MPPSHDTTSGNGPSTPHHAASPSSANRAPASGIAVPVSIIIPAHNEARVIARGLTTLTTGAEPGELEIVVVCNGCTDDTATAARNACADAIIIEVPVASKSAALNAGDAHATCFPRFYVDADVELSIPAIRATAAVLTGGRSLCAAPSPRFAVDGRSWLIRKFYDTWQRLPYLNSELVGTGVYALSARGRARFGIFPDLTADDQFVLQQFEQGERFSVRDECFIVHPPTSLRGLLRIRTRAYRGIHELDGSGFARHDAASGAGKTLVSLARTPRNLPAVVTYVAINLAAKGTARFSRGTGWERDESARMAC